jgi:hypothetical protein
VHEALCPRWENESCSQEVVWSLHCLSLPPTRDEDREEYGNDRVSGVMSPNEHEKRISQIRGELLQ